MNNTFSQTKAKRAVIACILIVLCAAAALTAVYMMKNARQDEDKAEIKEMISAYINSRNGYTKFPADGAEAYRLAYEKLRSMPYERVYLDGVHTLTLNGVSGGLTDRQASVLGGSLSESIDELNASFKHVFVDYGENIREYIPNISLFEPLSTASEVDSEGNYVITLELSSADAQKLVSDEDAALPDRVKSEKINEDITVNSAAVSVSDGFIRVVFNVYNSYISKIVIAVDYNVNLGCEFNGKLSDIEEENILLDITARSEYSSAREGIYFAEKSVGISKNKPMDLNYTLMISPDLSPEEYSVSFQSSAPDEVSVDGNGSVSTLSDGEVSAQIRAELIINGGNIYGDTCEVGTVTAVEKIIISERELFLSEGNDMALSAEIKPENATDKEVLWLSADESVAAVSQDGTVTAVGEGQTVIIAFSSDGSAYATCAVSVGN